MSLSHKQEIISELKQEHKNILSLFLLAYESDIKTAKGKSKFRDALFQLQLHDEKEEQHIYQPVRDLSLDQKEPEDVQLFSEIKQFGIENTLTIIKEFADNLEDESESNMTHIDSNFLMVIDVFKERVKFEEETLFEMCSKLDK
ncbi:MAG: hypothetical protein HQL69_09155 [Magnetococcales bacterium]|nr:hypothetical protein [Magnetococcales bacterium]